MGAEGGRWVKAACNSAKLAQTSLVFFFSSRRRHTRSDRDWSSDVCSSDLASEHGGELVYGYAGGVGIRSGDPEDVGRLLVAGLYHQAMLDRKAGRADAAAQLITQLAQRYPDDTSARLLVIESLIVDRRDGKAALAALARFPARPASRLVRVRIGLRRADAFTLAGH